ncbi:MAG TPA: AfsR/SARP family transcriptional regulator [Gaiellaceae bacterium]|nr:AfsR/SARP family transcriptional regulator [Gaiellaceae bacterium]
MTRFRVLGPLEASVDGQPVVLPGGKPSALLARLLLDAGRVVSVEALVDSLWGERAPPTAQKVLQVYISQLRKVLGAGQIETRAPGYLLRAERDEHDLGRFEALAESARGVGDPARRAKLLGEALSLWRGAPLAEFRDEAFAPAAARRLEELRLRALEQRIDADLELGEHGRLVGELEALVEQEPLREWPRRQLMLALYRAGRQAEALERYREGRRLLVQELGIEPSPRVQELERAILRHDPTLDGSAAPQAPRRGSVICPPRLAELLAPLCADGRELILVEIAADADELSQRAAELEEVRGVLVAKGVEARTVCFTSSAPSDDLARLAAEQEAELLVVSGVDPPERAPCDVALAPRPDLGFEPEGPVLVPFGGGREEWAALELGAWLARAHGLPLRLLGAEASEEQRDASRLLANASLALQRFAGTTAEPVLVAPGAEGILAESGSILVASLPAELDPTRQALAERTTIPLLLVRTGLRPGGLAPEHTLTRFSWSLRDA